jgi:hypothetical protein
MLPPEPPKALSPSPARMLTLPPALYASTWFPAVTETFSADSNTKFSSFIDSSKRCESVLFPDTRNKRVTTDSLSAHGSIQPYQTPKKIRHQMRGPLPQRDCPEHDSLNRQQETGLAKATIATVAANLTSNERLWTRKVKHLSAAIGSEYF